MKIKQVITVTDGRTNLDVDVTGLKKLSDMYRKAWKVANESKIFQNNKTLTIRSNWIKYG